MLVGSGRYGGLPQLITTTKIYVFPPRAPTFEAGFIIKPQLSHRDTQEAVGVADARSPDVQSCEARQLDDRRLPDLRPRCARSTMRSADHCGTGARPAYCANAASLEKRVTSAVSPMIFAAVSAPHPGIR